MPDHTHAFLHKISVGVLSGILQALPSLERFFRRTSDVRKWRFAAFLTRRLRPMSNAHIPLSGGTRPFGRLSCCWRLCLGLAEDAVAARFEDFIGKLAATGDAGHHQRP